MKHTKLYTLAFSMLLFSACSTKNVSKDIDQEANRTANTLSHLGIEAKEPKAETQEAPNYDYLMGEFMGNYKLESFIDEMVAEHGFERQYLNQIFSQAQNFNLIPQTRSCETSYSRYSGLGKWDQYRNCFIYEKNIERGLAFWDEHQATLERAEQHYGVPPEYIIGILGIETAYGTNFGKFRVIDVLTTKGMLPNRRNQFYTDELRNFLLLTRDAGLDPTELMGSTSGALGYGQFIPSSYRRFAVDFNGDGITDLWNADDAIGSIANYFARNGWNPSISQVAVRAKYPGSRFTKLKNGFKTKYSQYKLRKKHKITPRSTMHYRGPVSLIRLHRAKYDELWFGTHNFRVITTYNHSSHYGMAVYQLAQEVKNRRGY
ncbi:MAG TPA: lytic murein transglycosylase B [Campylobacterales bacterium]|nr:lytic murein transglycosylase B [Campylobacterales bacterium]